MPRFGRLMISLTTLLLPCCRTQPPVLPATSSLAEPMTWAVGADAIPPPSPQASPSPVTTVAAVEVVPPQPPPTSPPTPLPAVKGKVAALKAPPLECTDAPLPITFASALRLADARPLVVASAQASAWVAEAQLQRAKVIWVPELDLSIIYYRHDGVGPDFNRGADAPFNPTSTRLPIAQNFNWLYGGGGLYAVFPLTDAIFSPLAAYQDLSSRRWDIQTAKNDALLQTAEAYFNVHRYRGMYAGALDAVERGRELLKRIELLSEDLVPKAEVERARRLLADLEQLSVSAREEWRVASADLTQVLRLDPRLVVVPLEHDHLQITLVDPAKPLDDLIPVGLTYRPELASQQAAVQATLVRIRQEKLRPLIPSVIITGFQTPGNMRTQFGIFGMGADSKLNLFSFRDDVSTQLVWQLDGLGFGNLARIKAQRAAQSSAIVELFRIQDMVAAEVTQAQANMQSAVVRVTQAERGLRAALDNYEKNYEGLRQTRRFENVLEQVYRPQEAIVALENLKRAYDAYFTTVADYNLAQFRMYHALGYPAQDVSTLCPPGDTVPVDTSRPDYLPAVGTGPPPATR